MELAKTAYSPRSQEPLEWRLTARSAPSFCGDQVNSGKYHRSTDHHHGGELVASDRKGEKCGQNRLEVDVDTDHRRIHCFEGVDVEQVSEEGGAEDHESNREDDVHGHGGPADGGELHPPEGCNEK